MPDRKGHFSSRVLNMKFMQTAEKKEGLQLEEEQRKLLKDLSEWKLKRSDEIIAGLKKRQPKVSILSYTAIHALEQKSGISGRKTFKNESKADEVNEKSSMEEEQLSEKDDNEDKKEKLVDSYDITDDKDQRYKDGSNSAKNLLELWAAKNKKKLQRGVRKPRK